MQKLILSFLVAAAALSLAPTGAAAQTTSRFENWFAIPATVDFGDDVPRLQLWLDLHVRRGPNSTTQITRPAIGLRVYEWMIAYLGYAFIPTFVDSPQSVSVEHRLWEQLIMNASLHPRVAFQSRTRFEQRFSDASDDLGLRLRQLVRFGWMFADDNPFGLVLWEELFIGLADTNWGPTIGFDQNRLFIGPSVDIPHLGRLEVGYIFNYLRRTPADVVNHIFYAQLVVVL